MTADSAGPSALTREKEKELWRRLSEHRDPGAREELVSAYMPIARRMAARYSGVAEPYDDLLQVASLGLLNAVDRFDPSRGTPFAGFAKPTVLGELKRYFRDKIWTVRVPRSVHDLMARVDKASGKLALELHRPPTVGELSEELGVEPSAVLEVLEAAHNRRPLSLDAPPTPDTGEGGGAPTEWVGAEETGYELVEDRLALQSVLLELDPRDREILKLRFADELPQTEIAVRLGCSQMQVSRMLRRSLDRMREKVEASPEVSGRR
jgi:RNA polymerase sigma-B factor